MAERDGLGRFIQGSIGNPKGRTQRYATDSMSHLEYRRDYKLRSLYGITRAEYLELYTKQRGLCAICGQPETKILHGSITNLCVDHDHDTGKIRGLLCYRCNTGIGKLGDSSILLRKAAEYIEKTS